MLKKDKVKFIIEKLDELYPTVEPPLNHSSHFTLLIAVLLSANSTDKSVNKVTPYLFKIANTASVVMSQAFGYPAFAVDTHVHRCMYRWGLSTGRSVVQTEKDAKRLFPKDRWSKLHLQIIFYGREYCPAKNFNPNNCPITTIVGRRSLFK